MLYLKRKIDSFLEKWKQDPDRLPLIVRGPRQTGKTESILHFAKEHYESVVTINFVEEPKYKKITLDGYGVHDIIRNISRMDPSKRFPEGRTLLFFDELQEFPDIATALKFFRIDGRFDVICSGSLLGLYYKRIESNSVGYKQDYHMHSLDFEEFLWAKGYDGAVADSMLAHMIDREPFNELEMSLYHSLFLDFVILGGMPAVVRRYVEKDSFEGTLELQRQLVLDYEEDIRKYAEGVDQTRILNVFRHIPPQLAKENKKFQISKVAKGAHSKDYQGCVEWLCNAGIVNACYALQFPELPLKGNYDGSRFKLYFADTGLLVATLDEEAQDDLRSNRNLGVYKGALYENMVADALVKASLGLFYYKREDSTLEEDFFVRTKSSLLPLEVKAKAGTSKSLSTLISGEKYSDIRYGLKASAGNIGFRNRIFTFPYFCVFLLKRFLNQCEF